MAQLTDDGNGSPNGHTCLVRVKVRVKGRRSVARGRAAGCVRQGEGSTRGAGRARVEGGRARVSVAVKRRVRGRRRVWAAHLVELGQVPGHTRSSIVMHGHRYACLRNIKARDLVRDECPWSLGKRSMLKGSEKAPAFCAGARVAGSPELNCVDDDKSTLIGSCRRVDLRVSCTQKSRAAHVRAAEAGRVATSPTVAGLIPAASGRLFAI